MTDSTKAPLAHISPDTSPEHISSLFREAIEEHVKTFMDQQRHDLSRVSHRTNALVDAISLLSSGGKRLRPIFALWGALAAGGDANDERLLTLGTALELFQAAALIHDDIIDHSDTRRGQPAVHRKLEALHRENEWNRSASEFGIAGAILAGDIALALSETLFNQVNAGAKARELFDEMRTQVMAGQYLDVLAEQTGSQLTPDEAAENAWTIVTYKAARYSAEKPTLLGAALAGADQELLDGLSAFSLPAGQAFQLRDDELGVFGDPAQTGKPAGDDIREGKRTLLIALTRQQISEEQQAWLESVLGREDLDDSTIEEVRELIRNSGAAEDHARQIDALYDEAMTALDALDIPEQAREGLRSVAAAAVRRHA